LEAVKNGPTSGGRKERGSRKKGASVIDAPGREQESEVKKERVWGDSIDRGKESARGPDLRTPGAIRHQQRWGR